MLPSAIHRLAERPEPSAELGGAEFAADRRLQVAQDARGPGQHRHPRLIRRCGFRPLEAPFE